MDTGIRIVNEWIVEYEVQVPAYIQARLADKINTVLASKQKDNITEWRVFNDYKYEWEDCTMGIYCPTCKKLIVLDSQNGSDGGECCGKDYYLSAVVYTRDKPVTKG